LFRTFFTYSIDELSSLCHHSSQAAQTTDRNARGSRGLISFRASILASGSSGNATLLETERTCLLIDAGLGRKETFRRLAALEKSPERVDGILISHEHTDHASGLPQLLAALPTSPASIRACFSIGILRSACPQRSLPAAGRDLASTHLPL
jgi:glyoxylase-like metal-dependent hydrolase (beta-lactamase superfamily II)